MTLGTQCTCGGYKAAEAIHTTSGWVCGHCGGEPIEGPRFSTRTIYGKPPKGWQWIRRPEWQTALCISRMGL